MPSNHLDPIKVISFDGDATLWDFEKVMRHALQQALDHLRSAVMGPETVALTIDQMIEIRNAVSDEMQAQATRLEEIRYHAFVRTLSKVGVDDPDLAHRLNAIYRKHRFEDLELYPDVVEALDALAPRYTLGLLSNGNSLPETVGLGGRFAFVIFAQDVGVAKPDPAIFRVACDAAGCRPEELLHVGDSLESDVHGANTFGATSVWLNRDGLPNPSGILPDYEIRSLLDLLPILK